MAQFNIGQSIAFDYKSDTTGKVSIDRQVTVESVKTDKQGRNIIVGEAVGENGQPMFRTFQVNGMTNIRVM